MPVIKDDADFLSERRTNSAHRRSGALALTVALGLLVGGIPLAAHADSPAPDAGSAASTADPGAPPAADDPPPPESASQVDPADPADPANPGTPADPTDPSDPTPPPADPTPPADTANPPTDPPVDPTGPPTDPPGDPSGSPAEPTSPPAAPVPTISAPTVSAPTISAPQEPPTRFAPSPWFTNGLGSRGASSRLNTTAAAQLASLAAAQRELRAAQTRLADASAAYDMALERYNSILESAHQLDAIAAAAEATAEESTRLFLLAARGTDPQMGPFAALLGFTPGEELLDRLGTIDQLSRASDDPATASARAGRDIDRASALRERADAANRSIAEIPIAALKSERDAAAAAVRSSQTAVTSLERSTTAATEIAALPALPDDGRLSGQAWVLPARGPITDSYGPRPSRPAGAGEFHYGTDLGSGCHSWIVAASAGRVVTAGYNGGLGNWVLIDHGEGITTGYGHIEDGGIVVGAGDTVGAGEAIALAGSTGMSTGCHVHIEVAIDGVRTDAVPFFANRGVTIG